MTLPTHRPRTLAAVAAVGEPGMQVRGMRQHQINHDLQVQLMRPRDQRIEIRHRAELRVDVAVIADIISEILHGRAEERRNPHRIGAKRGDMVKPLGNAPQVARAIARRVLIAARVDLIDDPALPPIFRLFQIRH